MGAEVNRLAILGVALVAALTAPAATAAGADSRASDEGLWGPAFSLTGGILVQEQRSSVRLISETRNIFVRPEDAGSEPVMGPYVGASLELMTPAIRVIPGRPRLFINGEILPNFAGLQNIAAEGEPTGIRAPTEDDGITPLDPYRFSAAAFEGVGSKTISQIQTGVWAAGGGIAFPFEVRGRQLRVKPSVGWIRYEVSVEGVALAGLKDDPPVDQVFNNFWGPSVREVRLSGRGDMVVDCIGPGIELEMDLMRRGPLRPSIFIGGFAYRVLGNRKVSFSDTVSAGGDLVPDTIFSTYPPIDVRRQYLPDPETYTAEWSHELHPWMFRLGVGLRVRWLGN